MVQRMTVTLHCRYQGFCFELVAVIQDVNDIGALVARLKSAQIQAVPA